MTGLLAGLAGSAGAQDLQECGGVSGMPAWARDGAYRGTLGTLPIALQVNHQDASSYFYERRSLDILLSPFHAGEQLILQEEVRRSRGEPYVVTGCFTLMPSGTGLKGTWQAPGAGTAREVRLTPLDPARLPLALPLSPGLSALRRDNPLAFLKLNRAWVKGADGRSVREPLSGLTYPRVPGAAAALNAALQDRQLAGAVSALDCRAALPQDVQNDPDAGYDLRATLTLLKPRLVSLREDVYYDCGGAHPDTFTAGVILDRATGRSIPLAALWPKLTPARQKALYLNAVRRQTPAECLEPLNSMAGDFTAHLSAAGLNLTPTGLPHVVVACGETAVLSYASLRAEVNTRSAYFGDLYPR